MQVTTERLENCQVNVIIEMDAAETDKRLRQTARKLSREFNVPGYRKGKAPFAAVVRVFGREVVQQQGIEDFGQELYEQALEEIDYEPYEVGELQEVEWDPFRMTVTLPIQPEVDLGDYRSVRVPYEVEPVTEKQVDEYLAGLQEEHSQWVPADRPAAIGDQVVLDMQGAVDGADGVPKEVMNNKDYEMALEADATYPLPGFHEQIVGMRAGEEKSFSLLVPEDDEDTEAAGNMASITVHLHSVKEQDVPPLDDDLALMVGDYETLDDLRAGIRERLETEAAEKAEAEYLDKALDGFIEAAAKIEYPPQAVDREAEFSVDRMERNLASSGIQLDTYLGMIGKTRQAYMQELRPAAEERLKKRLVLAEITKREELAVEQEEVDAEVERMIEAMGEQAEEMEEALSSPGARLMMTDDLLTSKAQERVIEIAKGEAPPLSEGVPEAEAEEGDAAPVEAEEDVGEETTLEPEAEGEIESGDVEAEEPPAETEHEVGTETSSV
jgi:trigger factor